MSQITNWRHAQGHFCLWLQLWNWCDRLWLRLAWCGFEACRWPSFPPLLDTRWYDGENSTVRLFNTLEQVLTCDWNIFLVVDAHCQEVIHPRWIFDLVGGLFFKHLCEEWVVLRQFLHGWISKQWSFKWPTRSHCWHFIICCCGREAKSETAGDELSWRNPAFWNWKGFE